MNGQVTVKIGEQKRSFKFGLWVIERLQQTLDAQLTEVYDTGLKDENDNPILGNKFIEAMTENDIRFSAWLLYWGAYWACKRNKEEPDFEIEDCYEWLDVIGKNSDETADIINCFQESLRSYLPPMDSEVEVKKK